VSREIYLMVLVINRIDKVELNTGRYNVALSKHKKKVDGLMLTLNEVRDKIVSKKQEIVKLQSEQIAAKIEIEKAENQLKSMMELINKFEVIFFYIFMQFNVLNFITLFIEIFF